MMTPWQRLCCWLAVLCGLLALLSVTDADQAAGLAAASTWVALGMIRLAPHRPGSRSDPNQAASRMK